jgi:hypothetical protein
MKKEMIFPYQLSYLIDSETNWYLNDIEMRKAFTTLSKNIYRRYYR